MNALEINQDLSLLTGKIYIAFGGIMTDVSMPGNSVEYTSVKLFLHIGLKLFIVFTNY